MSHYESIMTDLRKSIKFAVGVMAAGKMPYQSSKAILTALTEAQSQIDLFRVFGSRSLSINEAKAEALDLAIMCLRGAKACAAKAAPNSFLSWDIEQIELRLTGQKI